MKKSLLLLFSVVLSVSMLLVGCGNKDKKAGSKDGGPKQEIVYAMTTKPVGMSPTMTNDNASSQVNDLMYETLFEFVDGVAQPLLAESYNTPDENTWEIVLKQDIQFHDGTLFNAEAVKYSFDKLKDPETAAPRASLLQPISEIEVKDEYTVVLKTKNPYGPMIAALAHGNAGIISPTADQKQDLMVDPVGTGPFKFDKKEQEDLIFVRNDDYWGDVPKIEKVTFKIVPAVDTALSMLQAGQANFLYNVTADSLPRLEGMKDVEIKNVEGTMVQYLVFNTNKGPAVDLDFRRAVAYAIDSEGLIASLDGTVYGSKGFIGPKLFGYDSSFEQSEVSFNLEKAQELVQDNGFGDKEFKLLTPNTPAYKKAAEAIQAQLTQAGFNVSLDMIEWATYLDVSREGDFEVAMAAWTNLTVDGSELLYPRLHSDNAGSTNLAKYSNPELDKLIEESRATIDQNERRAKLKQANELVLQELPVFPLYHLNVNIAVSKGVEGIQLEPNGNWRIKNAEIKN